VAPRVAIADGSHFRGSIDMQRKEQPAPVDRSSDGRVLVPSPMTDELVRV
jgi:hypothetical protein